MSSDPALAFQVATILAHPVSGQHPDLVHFRPPAHGAAASAGPSDPPPPPGPEPLDPRLPIAMIVAALALAAVFVVAGLRIQRGRWALRRTRVRIAAPLAGAAIVASGAGVAALLGGLWTQAPAAPMPSSSPLPAAPASMLSSLRSHAVWVAAGSARTTWVSLMSIETALATEHDHLVSDEQQITAVTDQLGASAATPTAGAMRPSAPGVLKTALEHLVSDHQTVLGSYDLSLQREYSFYVAAAQSPQSTSDLTSASALAPPDVQTAITTNLGLVQTQLQQEAQIAAATASEVATLQAGGAAVADLSGPAPAFDAPISGVLTQPFGNTQFPLEPPITYNGVFYPHFHTGIDLAAPLDTPVHAAAPGQVVLAASSVDAQGHLTGYGNFVMVAHADGYYTLYAHLDKILVKVGQSVRQGDVLGLLGSTGWSTGPHVHFEIRKGSVYVDPAPYLGSQIKS